ncbi:hypothetical protein POJ06DRAFT_270041 [Lipomyces tetrasporus]|uniref:N-acetyltransferase domain-containing protein n=1 Tax=Lipomyces tetrasporus TaxID=54092 RepID=A0AAD7VSB7_9ASCO|nr:uncharacterized protein POJ06DRAFT_270041 [Lipomyces tetrasporus]KAJ8098965.1 hypothetical protein POJ06DRAFT_270041 [Lipomyces tetrasporus]
MAKQLYEKFEGGQVTDDMLAEASVLFNENYGIWVNEAAKLGAFAKPGSRVRLSKDRLRCQCLPEGAACSYVRVTVDGHLAGNAFACRWISNGRTVCWITQLVVHLDFRERGLACGLLNQLREDDDDIYGLISSHPAACMAAAKVFGNSINLVNLDFIRKYTEAVMKVSPISYVKDAKLRGSLFDPGDTSGRISSVDTNFFVDHAEPLEALAWVRQEFEWPLGELLEGNEFVIILEVRRRARSRSRSASRAQSAA